MNDAVCSTIRESLNGLYLDSFVSSTASLVPHLPYLMDFMHDDSYEGQASISSLHLWAQKCD